MCPVSTGRCLDSPSSGTNVVTRSVQGSLCLDSRRRTVDEGPMLRKFRKVFVKGKVLYLCSLVDSYELVRREGGLDFVQVHIRPRLWTVSGVDGFHVLCEDSDWEIRGLPLISAQNTTDFYLLKTKRHCVQNTHISNEKAEFKVLYHFFSDPDKNTIVRLFSYPLPRKDTLTTTFTRHETTKGD